MFTHQQVFIKHLLCTRHSSDSDTTVRQIDKISALFSLHYSTTMDKTDETPSLIDKYTSFQIQIRAMKKIIECNRIECLKKEQGNAN